MITNSEAKARVKINKLLQAAGWRFEDTSEGKANISLESGVKFKDLDEDLKDAVTQDGRRGSIDFLLLDKDKRPLVVLEAKRESIEPLSAKEQARNYALSVQARFIILSNGNTHYLWDTKEGNPTPISKFPTQSSISDYQKYNPDPAKLATTPVDKNYVIATQFPTFISDPDFIDPEKRVAFLKKNSLKQLRPYQVDAIKSIQNSASHDKKRFLFEMATGTGKTLISSAVIKLFLKTGNARRVLFLVDRLELEDQAFKAFVQYLGKDFQTVIYKDSRDSWANASIVVSTVQTFLAGDRYKKEFSPTDFELVISDESHRSIGGNSRAVFEYFVGYKLGLTATPKNYLRGFDESSGDNQREYERRLLIDTYRTFGCEPGQPTFSYDLESGANDGYLIKPTLVDARTEITTELLSDEGYAVRMVQEDGEIEERFTEKHFEKKIFNDETNVAMCKALVDNGIYDPVAKELGIPLFGKTIVFAVSQRHAARLTNILNQIAFNNWPELYGQSDFAMQVSSDVSGAQQMTINFANNKLSGQVLTPEGYESSKTRITVTVGMMTTGYDCQDLLNIALMRPVFSPSDFVQIKGRGTRKWDFDYNDYADIDIHIKKNKFKFFDYFATCEYFENEFNYDEQIKLPKPTSKPLDSTPEDPRIPKFDAEIDLASSDQIATISETTEGVIMRIDREGFKSAIHEDVTSNPTLAALWTNEDYAGAEAYLKEHILDKPKNHLNLEGIRKLFKVDRRISVKEFLEVAFGTKEYFESKDELLESEWEKFIATHTVRQDEYQPVKNFFKAFIGDDEVRDIVKTDQLARFHSCASFDFSDYLKLGQFAKLVPQYINDYANNLIGI